MKLHIPDALAKQAERLGLDPIQALRAAIRSKGEEPVTRTLATKEHTAAVVAAVRSGRVTAKGLAEATGICPATLATLLPTLVSDKVLLRAYQPQEARGHPIYVYRLCPNFSAPVRKP